MKCMLSRGGFDSPHPISPKERQVQDQVRGRNKKIKLNPVFVEFYRILKKFKKLASCFF